MRILVVEDDLAQAEALSAQFETAIESCEVEICSSVTRFDERLQAFESSPPDVIVLDVMIRWSIAGAMPFYSLQTLGDDTFYRAGFRVLKSIQNAPTLKAVPVIIYTVIDRAQLTTELADLPPHYLFVSKQTTSEIVRVVRSLYPGLVGVTPKQSLSERLRESTSLTIRLFGASIDLKKLFLTGRRRR